MNRWKKVAVAVLLMAFIAVPGFAKKKKDDSEVVDDEAHEPPVRLYKYSIKDKKVTRLTTNTDWIQRWFVSKDGKYAAAIHGKSLRYQFVAKKHKLIFFKGKVKNNGCLHSARVNDHEI